MVSKEIPTQSGRKIPKCNFHLWIRIEFQSIDNQKHLAVPLRVGLSVPIFSGKYGKGFPLQSLTERNGIF
ncbi:MAG: hypothetical protein H7A24_06300 [Leptospiraceae bacterium]|nr:hypothetical protein [Leptospiraceae bacterium]MCP5511471.1 hypothetical protein [Leptospiraceae bacterium]